MKGDFAAFQKAVLPGLEWVRPYIVVKKQWYAAAPTSLDLAHSRSRLILLKKFKK